MDAADLSRQARTILDRAGDILGATYAAQSLAKALLRSGDLAAVPELLDNCLETCNRQRDQFGVALVTRTIGEYALTTGDLETAVERLTDALAQWTELGLPLWQARTLRDLAAARSADQDAADALWQRAIELFGRSDAREAGELAASSPGEWLAAVATYRKPVGSS